LRLAQSVERRLDGSSGLEAQPCCVLGQRRGQRESCRTLPMLALSRAIWPAPWPSLRPAAHRVQRLKTARSAVRSRPCPPGSPRSAACAWHSPAGRAPRLGHRWGIASTFPCKTWTVLLVEVGEPGGRHRQPGGVAAAVLNTPHAAAARWFRQHRWT